MSFFADLFNGKTELVKLDKQDIQGNIVPEVDPKYLKKRKTVKEIFELIKTDPHCFHYDRLDIYLANDPTYFLEKLEDIQFPILEKYIDKNTLQSMDILSCIIYLNNIDWYTNYTNTIEKFVMKVMEKISKLYGGVYMPKGPYLPLMLINNFDITRISQAIKYCDVNATYNGEGNLLFFVQSYAQFDAIYPLCKDKINLACVDSHGNNFIHHYIKKNLAILHNHSFLKYLKEFQDKGFVFNLFNKSGYNIFTYALLRNNIEFVIEISKLDFIDFTITNDSKNWFIMLITKKFHIDDIVKVLKNVHNIGKLNTNFLNLFFDFYFPITRYNQFRDAILNLIESFILNVEESKYKPYFEYADDGMTIAHKLAKINHKKALRFIMEHTNIKFIANKQGEYPMDIYKKNKFEKMLEGNNIQTNILLLQ